MSHVSYVDTKGFGSLIDIKSSCKDLGIQFTRKKTYKWYGTFVGDSPLPDGMTVDELGHCDYCIHVPGASYEIGVVKRGDRWFLVWDNWLGGRGLTDVLGGDCHKLIERINLTTAMREFRKMGQQFTIEQDALGKPVLKVLDKIPGAYTRVTFRGEAVNTEGMGYTGKACTKMADKLMEAFNGTTQRNYKREYSRRRTSQKLAQRNRIKVRR